jgi:hypothetical protein
MLRIVSLARHKIPFIQPCRYKSTSSIPQGVKTDELGIPLEATWSVRALLESYPRPTLSPDALDKLHRLSALIPPDRGSTEHAKLTEEMEDLIKLVEAVRLPELTQEEQTMTVPDGRIWTKERGIEMDTPAERIDPEDGRELLKHAARTEGGMYTVESDRVIKSSQVESFSQSISNTQLSLRPTQSIECLYAMKCRLRFTQTQSLLLPLKFLQYLRRHTTDHHVLRHIPTNLAPSLVLYIKVDQIWETYHGTCGND